MVVVFVVRCFLYLYLVNECLFILLTYVKAFILLLHFSIYCLLSGLAHILYYIIISYLVVTSTFSLPRVIVFNIITYS